MQHTNAKNVPQSTSSSSDSYKFSVPSLLQHLLHETRQSKRADNRFCLPLATHSLNCQVFSVLGTLGSSTPPIGCLRRRLPNCVCRQIVCAAIQSKISFLAGSTTTYAENEQIRKIILKIQRYFSGVVFEVLAFGKKKKKKIIK